ncbi:choice-of-anchor A family protein [Streptomyces sp. NPDC059894]|uniref:choice-of-anchor A family protein n=1 Tax=unclassified Streptomyces TaxID=2593676 RepID=UPI003657A494
MPIPVRKLSFALTAALGGSLALGVLAAPVAAAATTTCESPFGVADGYGEFIETSLRHTPDAEGAVAVGGNADFTGGFSVGQELTASEVNDLPGGNALVVGGDIKGTVNVMKGNALHTGIVDGKIEMHQGRVTQAASPIDFTAEFAKLRNVSDRLSAKSDGAAYSLAGTVLQLTGTDADSNSFVIPASDLVQAKEVRIKVPVGAVTIVNVTGTSYDQATAGTSSFRLYDAATGTYVNDDKTSSASGGQIRAKLLWNFPEATSVAKNSPNAWPGSILAPKAAFDLGSGGPVNGSVIARSLTGTGSAETHHYPFTGCLPDASDDSSTGESADTPSGTATGDTPQTDSDDAPTPSSDASSATDGTDSEASSGDNASSTSGSPTEDASAPADTASDASGDLALTGAGMAGPLAIAGALVVALGAAVVLLARRRKV